MPNTIYMPQDPRYPAFNQAAGNISRQMYDMMRMRAMENYLKQRETRAQQYQIAREKRAEGYNIAAEKRGSVANWGVEVDPVSGQEVLTSTTAGGVKRISPLQRGKQGDMWVDLPPVNVHGSILYPQRNLKDNSVKFFRVPPMPKEGTKGEGGKSGIETSRQIQSVQDELNEIRKANGAGDVDILALMALPSKERKEFLKAQTGPILGRIKNKQDRVKYKQLMIKLDSLVSGHVGGLPPLKQGTKEEALNYIQQANGDIEKAQQMALADGIILE